MTCALLRVGVNRFPSFLRGSVGMEEQYCGSKIFYCDFVFVISRFLFFHRKRDSSHRLQILRVLKMTTAVDVLGKHSFLVKRGTGQDGIGVDCSRRLSFSCFLCVRGPILLAHHTVVQRNIASSETDYDIPRWRMQQAMVT